MISRRDLIVGGVAVVAAATVGGNGEVQALPVAEPVLDPAILYCDDINCDAEGLEAIAYGRPYKISEWSPEAPQILNFSGVDSYIVTLILGGCFTLKRTADLRHVREGHQIQFRGCRFTRLETAGRDWNMLPLYDDTKLG